MVVNLTFSKNYSKASMTSECIIIPVLSIDGPLLYKAEAELKESESNKRKALENLQKLLLKSSRNGE